MRAMLGVTIAVPVALVFCLSYLLMLGLETGRDAIHSRRRARPLGLPLLERHPPIFRGS